MNFKDKQLIPLAIPDLRGNPSSNLRKAIKSNWISSAGPAVNEFESLICKEVRGKYVLATITGSAALHLALKIFGIGKGHRVLVPDLTFAATINSIIISGAEPILVDVDKETWTLDIQLTKKAILKYKPQAIIVVHTLGHPAKMDELKEISSENKIVLIEDAAGALGAKYKNKKVGALSDAGIFSFNGNKVLSTGSGGALILNKKSLFEKGKILYNQGRIKKLYNYSDVGYNYRMSNINASLGVSQIPYLNSFVKKKINIAKKYDKNFINIESFKLMPRKEWATSSCWLYSLLFKSRKSALSFNKYLSKKMISSRFFWNALSLQKPYKNYKSILNGTAFGLSNKIISIPCSTSLTKYQQDRVIVSIKKWSKIEQN